MRTRRHHNNKGLRQIKLGKTERFLIRLAKRMGIQYGKYNPKTPHADETKD